VRSRRWSQPLASTRRTRQRRRPSVDRRRQACQAFLLWRYTELRDVEETIRELVALHRTNPRLYRELVEDGRPLSNETLRRYWKDIMPDLKRAARNLEQPLPTWRSWLHYLAFWNG